MSIGEVWIYRLMFVCAFVCTVTDFSVEDKASGTKFCTAVHRRPRQGISHFCELCFPRNPTSDKLEACRLRSCMKNIIVEMRLRKRHARAPLKLRPYGAIQMCILLLLLLEMCRS